ncbi:adenylylsulfate kinase-like enzyme [Oxalobacteraceae bacterium GrIS 2.11]
MTGLDSPYEIPEQPDLTIDTSTVSIHDPVEKIMKYLAI